MSTAEPGELLEICQSAVSPRSGCTGDPEHEPLGPIKTSAAPLHLQVDEGRLRQVAGELQVPLRGEGYT
jgi:hypothetical protein